MPKTRLDTAADIEKTAEAGRQEPQASAPHEPSASPLQTALERLEVVLERIAPYPMQGG